MGVSSGRSRVAELAFRVFARPIHPEWFAVHAHRRVACGDWLADVRLVEGGHVVHWQLGGLRLTETLVGPETPLPEPGLLFHSAVRHDRSAELRPAGLAEYQTCFDVEHLDPEVFRHLSDELAHGGDKRDLAVAYAPANRLGPSPLSRLHIEPRVRGLSIQVFHTFPDERAIVRTQSLFEVAGVPKAR